VHLRSPAAVTDLLRHPPVGAWLAHCLRRLHEVPDGRRSLATDLGHLCGIAAAAATRAGQTFEITVPVLDRTVVLPSLGRAVPAPGTGGVVVRGQSGRLHIPAAGRRVTTVTDPAADGDGWQSLRRIEIATGSPRLVVLVDDTDPFRDCYGRPVLPRLSAAEFTELRGLLRQAWRLLAGDHPKHAAMLAALPLSLVPLLRPAADREVSAASRHAFGSIGMSIPTDPVKFAEILVHEHNHVRLGALMDLAPLHTGPSSIRYQVPWRDDVRPVGAVLQGTYAHLGVADFWRIHRHKVHGTGAAAADTEFAGRWDQASRGVNTLAQCDELTAAGRRFVQGMANTLAGWRHDRHDSDR
jgi:HEXXH motif-containing protein